MLLTIILIWDSIAIKQSENPVYICICNAVTDKEIRKAAKAGANSLSALQEELGVAINCGSCSEDAAAILRESRQKTTSAFPRPKLYRPATA